MHLFPLVRAGGLFLMVVGVGLVAGAFSPKQRWVFAGAAAVLATFLTAAAAPVLVRPFGAPTVLQIAALAIAVAVEALMIATFGKYFRRGGSRSYELGMLFIVGLHFLPMGVAFGPVIGLLGLGCTLNAGHGLWIDRNHPSAAYWGIDGLMKVGAGALMFLLALA